MDKPAKATTRPSDEQDSRERGAVLIIATLMLFVLMGMAAFAVDLGWLFLKGNHTQKAAEAAALAGVVHMPLPGSVAFPDSDAYSVAIDVAGRNGFPDAGVTNVEPLEVPTQANHLRVEITTTVPTFFMKVFGISQVSFTKGATASHLPPLQIASDEPFLGQDPTDPSRDTDYWLSVNGTYTGKGQGDPFSTICYNASNTGSGSEPYANALANGACLETGNYQYRDPAYWYAVKVPVSEAGSIMTIEVFDGGYSGYAGSGFETSDYHYRWDYTPYVTRFRVLAPDQTPADPSDNSVEVCDQRYYAYGHPSYDASAEQVWDGFCTVTAIEGIYVIELSVEGDTYSNNKFSLRTIVGGAVSNDVEMFGFDALSLAMNEAGSAPSFQVARLDPIYAGEAIMVGLWDAGDLGEPGVLRFLGSLAGIECQVRVLDDYGAVVQAWSADDGEAGCMLDIAPQEFNGQWIQFRFDIPPTHTCGGAACWATVQYQFASNPHDRTTWVATILGGPIHLEP